MTRNMQDKLTEVHIEFTLGVDVINYPEVLWGHQSWVIQEATLLCTFWWVHHGTVLVAGIQIFLTGTVKSPMLTKNHSCAYPDKNWMNLCAARTFICTSPVPVHFIFGCLHTTELETAPHFTVATATWKKLEGINIARPWGRCRKNKKEMAACQGWGSWTKLLQQH